jgi:hypothetical protein
MKKNSTELKRKLQSRLEAFEEKKAEFIEQFKADPIYALRWSHSMFEIAHKIELYKKAVQFLNEGREEEELVQWLEESLKQHSRHPSNSTSPAANLLDQCEGPALWDLLDLINSY